MLLGRNEFKPKNTTVLIKNLDDVSGLIKAGQVRVIAKRIPDSGWKALPEPKTVLDEKRPVTDNTLTLRFPGLNANEALTIQLIGPE
jgi:hypothetical protein